MISTIFVVIIHDMYLRTVKVRSSSGLINEYVRVVEAYRDNGKVKQRTRADLGRKDLLVEILPKLQSGSSAGTARTPPRPKPRHPRRLHLGAGPRRPDPVRPIRAVDHPRRGAR